MLCGDETNAIVVDLGTSQCRFGTAGQDVPRHNFSSHLVHSFDDVDCYSAGDHALRCLQEGNQVVPFFEDGSVDPLRLESLVKYGVENQMRLNTQDYALMLSKGKYFKSKESQMKIMEMCFESLKSPALYLMDESVLSAFCMGRRTCLVVDLSSSAVTITPVADGFALRSGSFHDKRFGGDHIDQLISQYLSSSKYTILPWFMASNFPKRATFHPSFVDYHHRELLRDIKHTMSYIPHYRVDDEYRSIDGLSSLGVVLPDSYHLPDGVEVSASYDLCMMPERVFFPDREDVTVVSQSTDAAITKKRPRSEEIIAETNKHPLVSDSSSLASLVYKSVLQSDVDIRRELLNNIVLVGGQSVVSGLQQRLQKELEDAVVSQLKIKVHARLSIERKFAPWIGGSILSICGSFQQCWLSKAQYDEDGVDRCVAKMDMH